MLRKATSRVSSTRFASVGAERLLLLGAERRNRGIL